MKPLPRSLIILRRTLLGLAAAVTLVAIGVLEENLRGQRAWERFHRERAAGGMPLDFAAFTPTPVPDDQNLYRQPVVAQFFNFEDGTGAAWKAYEARLPVRFYASAPTGTRYLFTSSWQYGRPADLAPALAAAGGHATGAPAVAAAFLAKLAPLRSDLDAVAAAAQWRTQAQIPFQPDGTIVRDSVPALRSLVILLTWRAEAELALGQHDQAFADTFAALRLADGCQHFPTIVHAGFGQSLVQLALQPLWEGWISGAWSDQQLAIVPRAFHPFHTYLEVGQFVGAVAAAGAEDLPEIWPRRRELPAGWIKLAAITLLRPGAPNALRALDAQHRPLTLDGLEQAFLLPAADAQSFPLRLFGAGGSQMSLPVQPRFLLNFAAGQTAWQLADVACALQRYHRTHNRYPVDLGTLVPDYLPELPFDYMDGNRLRYHPTPQGSFVLYSIGRDRRDDDGQLPTIQAATWSWTADGAGGDWTWPVQPSPASPAHS